MQKVQLLFTIIFFFFGFIAYAQKPEKISNVRQLVINYPDSTVKAFAYSVDKKIKLEENIAYFWFQSNSIKMNIGGIGGRPLHGKYLVYDRNNNMICEGYFDNGIKHGDWKKWYPGGGLKKQEEWKKGIKSGTTKTYATNGELIEELSFKNGLLDGECKYYSGNGTTIRKFNNGVEKIKEEKVEKEENVEIEKTDDADKKFGRKLMFWKKKSKKSDDKAEPESKPDTDVEGEKSKWPVTDKIKSVVEKIKNREKKEKPEKDKDKDKDPKPKKDKEPKSKKDRDI